jgi:hypothetical protein
MNRFLRAAIAVFLISGVVTGMFLASRRIDGLPIFPISYYSQDPGERLDSLSRQAEDLRRIKEQWEAVWGPSQRGEKSGQSPSGNPVQLGSKGHRTGHDGGDLGRPGPQSGGAPPIDGPNGTEGEQRIPFQVEFN